MNMKNIQHGAYAGVVGGVVFGAMMGMMGMLPMIGQMVGSPSAAAGFIVHIFISASIGGSFAVLFHPVLVGTGSGLGYGAAYGAGLQIALGADLRFATADSRLSVMEIRWGIIPDMAISTTLPRLMPTDSIKELAWTGRIVSGEEACSLGLITAVHENPSQVARETAQAIVNKSPDAVRAIKRLFDKAAQLPDDEALQLEARLQMSLLGSPNQAEAVTANLEKRSAVFKDSQG